MKPKWKFFKSYFTFVLRDMWIGAYWSNYSYETVKSIDYTFKLYICFIPCFPLVLIFTKDCPKRNYTD